MNEGEMHRAFGELQGVVKSLKDSVSTGISDLKADIAVMRTEQKADMNAMRLEQKEDIKALRSEQQVFNDKITKIASSNTQEITETKRELAAMKNKAIGAGAAIGAVFGALGAKASAIMAAIFH